MAAERAIKKRDDAMLLAMGSISKVLGKEGEYQDFLSYLDYGTKERMPSKIEIANHTPMWVQLVMPFLGKIYDTAFFDGYKEATDAFRHAHSKDTVW